MAEQNPFENRIIGYGTKPADQFQANALNYRKHPQRQRDAVQASLRELGWIGVVVENRITGNLIDGHERVWQALKNNEPVPYIEVELSEAEEKLALAVFDPIGAMAETDTAILDALLRDVNTGETALQELLAGLAEDAGLYGDAGSDVQDVEPQIDRAEELRAKWGVESGQLWQLGEHRIVCGDSSDAALINRLMGGERASLVFTDPPYGVAIGAKNCLLNSVQPSGRNSTDIEDDSLSPAELKAQLLPVFNNIRTLVMADDCTVFVTAPQRGELGMMMMMMMQEAKLTVRHVLIWKKNQPTFSMGRLDYDYQHEPILLTWGKRHKRPMKGEHRTSIWEIDKPRASPDHPTTKPVELVINALLNNSDAGDIAFDAYSGSGTTLMACEMQGRRARVSEISPAYVAVALERWATATQREPIRVE